MSVYQIFLLARNFSLSFRISSLAERFHQWRTTMNQSLQMLASDFGFKVWRICLCQFLLCSGCVHFACNYCNYCNCELLLIYLSPENAETVFTASSITRSTKEYEKSTDSVRGQLFQAKSQPNQERQSIFLVLLQFS